MARSRRCAPSASKVAKWLKCPPAISRPCFRPSATTRSRRWRQASSRTNARPRSTTTWATCRRTCRRSKAVSSDVADTIEGLMPPLMEIFAAGEEVVQFAPVGPEDVAAAEQETDYVNHVFMQQNPGFLVLYSFIKDALLSKVGVVKVWWECREEVER